MPPFDARVGVVVERAVTRRDRVRVAVVRRLSDDEVRVAQIGDVEMGGRARGFCGEVRVGVARTGRVARRRLRQAADRVGVVDPDARQLIGRVGDVLVERLSGGVVDRLVVLRLRPGPLRAAELTDPVSHVLAGVIGVALQRRGRRALDDLLGAARLARGECALLTPAPIDDVDVRRGLNVTAPVGHVPRDRAASWPGTRAGRKSRMVPATCRSQGMAARAAAAFPLARTRAAPRFAAAAAARAAGSETGSVWRTPPERQR